MYHSQHCFLSSSSSLEYFGVDSNMLPITTIGLQSRIAKMRDPFILLQAPVKGARLSITSQLRAHPEMHRLADEETQVRIEKLVGEEHRKEYFSSDKFRIVSEEDQPQICLFGAAGPKHVIPESRVALYRIERFVQPDYAKQPPGGGWKIHILYFYVHASPPYHGDLLTKMLSEFMRQKDEAGELPKPDPAFSILQWGHSIGFFQYAGKTCIPLQESFGKVQVAHS